MAVILDPQRLHEIYGGPSETRVHAKPSAGDAEVSYSALLARSAWSLRLWTLLVRWAGHLAGAAASEGAHEVLRGCSKSGPMFASMALQAMETIEMAAHSSNSAEAFQEVVGIVSYEGRYLNLFLSMYGRQFQQVSYLESISLTPTLPPHC